MNAAANNAKISINFRASGTSSSFSSKSGWVDTGSIGRLLTDEGGSITIEASSKIVSGYDSQMSTTQSAGKIFLKAPEIDNSGASPSGGTLTTRDAFFRTDKLSGPANITTTYMNVSPYTDSRTVYVGVQALDNRCNSALCITQQFSSGSSIGRELFIFTLGDIYVESGSPGFAHSADELILAARNNLTLNAPLSAPGISDPMGIGLYAGNKFVNNVGASALSVSHGKWGIITGSSATATLNGLTGTETTVADPWPSSVNTDTFETYVWADEARFKSLITSSGGNVIGYFNSSATQTVVDQQAAQQNSATTVTTTITDTSSATTGVAASTAQVTYESTATVASVTDGQEGRVEQRVSGKMTELVRKTEGELKAEAGQARAESRKIEAEARKVETEAKKAETEAKKAEAEAKKAEAEAKKAEASPVRKAEVQVKKAEAEAKKAEAEAKKDEAQSKKAEAESKKAEAESKEAAAEAKGARGAKKAELTEKAEEKRVESVQRKAEAEVKKAKAEEKKLEAEAHKAEAEGRKTEAQAKRMEAEKRAEARRTEAVKSFAARIVGQANSDTRAMLMAMRHEYKTEILQPALNILEANPRAADLPTCGSGAGGACMPTPEQVQQKREGVKKAAALARPAVAIPTVSFLPQIQRKVAVMLGVNDYADKAIPALESAIPDAEAVGNLLKGQLGYEVRVVKNATRAGIVDSLSTLANELGPDDSVTIYYAGHGYQMKETGYWIPSDASVKNPDNWISNNDVSRLMGNIPAKQVMLISDSCYSGAFAKEQKVGEVAADAQAILNNRSVVIMSSGGEEPVSDEGRDGHSIFAWNLMNSLKTVDKFDPGSKLFSSIRKGVIEEFPQVPQYATVTSAGHVVGGDYLFEARSYK